MCACQRYMMWHSSNRQSLQGGRMYVLVSFTAKYGGTSKCQPLVFIEAAARMRHSLVCFTAPCVESFTCVLPARVPACSCPCSTRKPMQH
jgi:hypothetical protein